MAENGTLLASSNTVNHTSDQQLISVDALNKAAGKLNENPVILVQEVSKFTVEKTISSAKV